MNKIKEEQLKRIQGQQKELNDILYEVGMLEAKKHGLLHEFAGVNKEVMSFRDELENEYGSIQINVETGEYTEIVNEDPQPELNPELNKVE